MMKNKKALVMSVLCAVASVGFVMSVSKLCMVIWMRLLLKGAEM